MSSIGKEHVEDGLLLRAMDEELAQRQALRVKEHIEQCADCRARFERLRAVTSRVVEYHREAILMDQTLAESERRRFLTRLDQAGAEAPRPGWSRWFAQPALWRRAAWCGALSLLILAGLVVGIRRSRPAVSVVGLQQAEDLRPRQVVPASPAPKQLVARVAGRPPRRVPKRRGPVKRVPEETSRERVPSGEIVTPFFSLPYSDASLPLDQAAVIRVELPRSALTLTGMPVPEDRRNERVHADLIVGADGLARAIRFVR